jgi:glycine/D-amino acid oxidase-like deaminating enzyme
MGASSLGLIARAAVPQKAKVIVAGGGLLGLSIAACLSRRLPGDSILLVERRPKLLGETSSASTGGFRNFYPESPSMTALSNLSIDALLRLNAAPGKTQMELVRTGYTFFSSAAPSSTETSVFHEAAQKAARNGTGPVRVNPDIVTESRVPPDGMDILTDPSAIQKLHPNIAKSVISMMRVNRAGYINVDLLGTHHFIWT